MNATRTREILLSAGAVLSLAAASAPLYGIHSFQEKYFEIFPISLIVVSTTLAAFGGLLAAWRLPGATTSKGKTVLLLAAPVLLSLCWAAALHLKAGSITIYAEFPYYASYPADPYTLGDAMLVQKPYTGEVFMIDSAGKRAEVSRGSLFPRLKYLFPEPGDNNAIVTRGEDGALWVLQHPSSATARLLKGGIDGFKELAVLPFSDGYPIWLERGDAPVLTRHIKGEGDFYSHLPYGDNKIDWKKISDAKRDRGHGLKTREKEAPRAIIKGETFVYGKDRWHVPGARRQESPFDGYHFKNWSAFFVPAEGKNGPFTYFCRTGAEPQPAWPAYTHNGSASRRFGSRIMTTIKGAFWWRDWQIDDPVYVYLVVNEEGKPLPPFRLSPAMLKKAGADARNTALLRATGDDVWLNLAGKHMARVSATNPERFELWEFPATTFSKPLFSGSWNRPEYELSVRAVSGGAMITAMNGVYLMDWAGGLKKLY